MNIPRNPHLGIACPPWCATNHAEQFGTACVGGGGSIGNIWTRAIRGIDGYQVGITGLGNEDGDTSKYLGLGVADAEQLAGLVELLADDTPAYIRELAAAIRKAAADATEAGQ
jgi:prephenate dehydrogenase